MTSPPPVTKSALTWPPKPSPAMRTEAATPAAPRSGVIDVGRGGPAGLELHASATAAAARRAADLARSPGAPPSWKRVVVRAIASPQGDTVTAWTAPGRAA